eukprot:1158333-Pelagomonas_calceolata.AAC.7
MGGNGGKRGKFWKPSYPKKAPALRERPTLASKVLGVAGWMVALDACALVRTLKEEGTCKRANLCEWAATAVHAHGFPDSIFFFYYKLVLQLQLSYSASLWWIENSTSQAGEQLEALILELSSQESLQDVRDVTLRSHSLTNADLEPLLVKLPQLQLLSLSHNLLHQIPMGFSHLQQLCSLNINHNHIDSLEGLRSCTSLKELYAGSLWLNGLKSMRKLPAPGLDKTGRCIGHLDICCNQACGKLTRKEMNKFHRQRPTLASVMEEKSPRASPTCTQQTTA